MKLNKRKKNNKLLPPNTRSRVSLKNSSLNPRVSLEWLLPSFSLTTQPFTTPFNS